MEPLNSVLTNPVLTVKEVLIDSETLQARVITADREDCDRVVGGGFNCLVCRGTGIVRHDFLDQNGYAWGFACYCGAGAGIGAQAISQTVYRKLLELEAKTLGVKYAKSLF